MRRRTLRRLTSALHQCQLEYSPKTRTFLGLNDKTQSKGLARQPLRLLACHSPVLQRRSFQQSIIKPPQAQASMQQQDTQQDIPTSPIPDSAVSSARQPEIEMNVLQRKNTM
jgi:hypothetical protein